MLVLREAVPTRAHRCKRQDVLDAEARVNRLSKPQLKFYSNTDFKTPYNRVSAHLLIHVCGCKVYCRIIHFR